VFAGGPGTGKSRAAAAVARCYRNLGLLSLGHMAEVVAADVADIKPWEAAKLLDEAASQVPGGVLMNHRCARLVRPTRSRPADGPLPMTVYPAPLPRTRMMRCGRPALPAPRGTGSRPPNRRPRIPAASQPGRPERRRLPGCQERRRRGPARQRQVPARPRGCCCHVNPHGCGSMMASTPSGPAITSRTSREPAAS
jgi:hypothetical protein